MKHVPVMSRVLAKHWLGIFVLMAAVGCLTALLFQIPLAQAQKEMPQEELAGTITGKVFHDYNSNGNFDTTSGLNSIDFGVSGITVTAFDSSGTQRGTTTTGSGGTFSLAATGTGPYRLEFTNLPAGYQFAPRSTNSLVGGSATDSGSGVQFVADGATADVNIAITRPEEYCQNNPTVVVPRFAQGAANGIYGNNVVLIDFPYNAGTTYTDTTVSNYDNPTSHTLTTQAQTIGTVYATAYSRLNNRIYAASYFKRHAGFGRGADNTQNTADDPAAIYVINPATSAVVSTFTVSSVTTNSHNTGDYGFDNGDTGWDAVGKTSFGGMALADDESRLFVVNLEDRLLHALNPTTGAELASVSLTSPTLPTPGGTRTNCRANNERPFALKFYRGNLYVGYVCSGTDASDLFAYVFQVDPTTLAIGSTPVFQTPLNYSRGLADPGWAAEWNPWIGTIQADFAYPQPMLTDIEFENGNLILGIKDRVGDQALDAGPDGKRTAGDTIRACGTFGSWTVESNGRCGGTGSAPQNTGQGIGNGEFYHQDDFCSTPNGGNYHDEVSWGSLTYIPGRQHVVTTLLDPINRQISSGATFDGGFRWFNNSTGNAERAYRVYNGNGGTDQPDFGKTNGLGDVTAMCSAAPIEIGNRVWRDSNNNGVQDPQESRAGAGYTTMAGITVRLYNASNVLVATAVTDQDGEYYFSSAPGTNTTNAIYNLNLQYNAQYQIRFDNPANYASGGTLFGHSLSPANTTSQNGDDDASDSDASNVVNPSGSPAGTFPVISLTTGGVGASTHRFDVGFAPPVSAASVNIGGRAVTASGRGIANARITLTESDGNTRVTLTNAFGYYRFVEIPAGQTVIVSALSKRYAFSEPTRLVQVDDAIENLNFTEGKPLDFSRIK